MNMKEQIHTLSEEMIANLGRLVAIDSQLGTPEEGRHRRYESFLGKECVCNQRFGYAL